MDVLCQIVALPPLDPQIETQSQSQYRVVGDLRGCNSNAGVFVTHLGKSLKRLTDFQCGGCSFLICSGFLGVYASLALCLFIVLRDICRSSTPD